MTAECPSQMDEAATASSYCASVFAREVAEARGLVFDPRDGALLVIERGAVRILALYDADDDGVADERIVVATAGGLSHGIALDAERGLLFASSASTVYRWSYTGDRTEGTDRVVAVNGIPTGGHETRTLLWDGRLFVAIGSKDNVDGDSSRSRVKLCDAEWFSESGTSGSPLNFESECTIWADGVRNECALTFDRNGVIWGVENGADRLIRSDLGNDIVQDNPAEELNRLDKEGAHYGYPYCFTEYNLPSGNGRGTVWGWPEFLSSHGDDWCRSMTEPPVLALQGHSAPLGIAFYDGPYQQCRGSFPSMYQDDAFVAFHGSWNRDIPTGYKIVRISNLLNNDTSSVVDFLSSANPGVGAKWASGFRPVDVVFDACGRLYISSDGTRYSNDRYSEGLIVRVCFGNCGGTNYSAVWSDQKKDEGNEWFQTTAFNASVVAFCAFVTLILAGYVLFFKRGRRCQKKQNVDPTGLVEMASEPDDGEPQKSMEKSIPAPDDKATSA